MCRWTLWDGTGRTRWHLTQGQHQVYFYRQYISRAGFNRCETNQLITNLKKSPSASRVELYYKNQAIQQFSQELCSLFSTINYNMKVTWIPSSKAPDDPEYDDRLIRVVQNTCSRNNYLEAAEVFTRSESSVPLHGGGERNPDKIAEEWEMNSRVLNGCNYICIVDDVLTTGASFRAAHDLIVAAHPGIFVFGAIWAFTIDDPDIFSYVAESQH